MKRAFPEELEVVIDVPRFGFTKHRDDGRVAFVSPLPCPFNYGSVPGTRAADGDREDAIVLGARLPRGARVRVRVVARVRFVDEGRDDAKWICSQEPVSAAERALVAGFFVVYAGCKRGVARLRGRKGATSYEGVEWAP